MVSPSRCPPWQPERPGPTRREPRRAQRSYTTPRDTILERFAASGLDWAEACDMDEEALEAALYRISRASDWPEVNWAMVE